MLVYYIYYHINKSQRALILINKKYKILYANYFISILKKHLKDENRAIHSYILLFNYCNHLYSL